MSIPRLSVGDMAQANLMKLSQARLKSDLLRLSDELSTGRRATLHPKLGGDVSPLSALERARAAVTPWQGAASEAAITFDAAQVALETFQGIANGIAFQAIDVSGVGGELDVERMAVESRNEFARMIDVLNTATGGRSLFAGTATDTQPLIDGEDILAQIAADAVTAGAVATSDYIAVIDAYFDAGGGFDTTAYQGGDPTDEVRISADESLSSLPTADDDALRDVLRAAALAAIAGDDSLGLTAIDRQILVQTAGEDLLSAETGLVGLRATLGRSQEIIDTVTTRLTAEATTLDLAILDLTEADPYETASLLEATQIQLETLYAAQARLSTLGLAGYLR